MRDRNPGQKADRILAHPQPPLNSQRMPTISITLSAAAATEFTDAMCAAHNYPATVIQMIGDPPVPTEVPNPETRTVFARRMLLERMKSFVRDYRHQQARTTTNAQADADIT